MAIVKCPDCAKVYDDFYRWTQCPHETFQPSASAAADPQVIAYAARYKDFEPATCSDELVDWLQEQRRADDVRG
jgi:hypothetical protein